MPTATLNLNNYINIRENALKLQDFFTNLAGKNLMWLVSVDGL